jgi:hypothetical protein
MCSSTIREVSYDPRDIKLRQRRSSRLNRKHPDIRSRKSSTSSEAKMPKIVKSSSSTERARLKTLFIPKNGSPKVIKSHEDSENIEINHHSKCSFGFHQT